MQLKTIKWKLAQTVELFWWKNYLRNKNTEEYKSWKINYWLKLLSKIDLIEWDSSLAILDCGCGPAGIFIALPTHLSIDAEDPLLEAYENQLSHFQVSDYPNVTFYNQPIEDFKPKKMYDVIFCMNAINHVSNIEFCYDKLFDMLKPNGKLIMTIDAHNYSFFKHFFRMIPGDILHPHQYDLKEYTTFLSKRGLTILQSEKLKSEFFFNHYLQVARK